jgi:diacylglycerol diphosphate phosphatase/phosphatidate phosphatase
MQGKRVAFLMSSTPLMIEPVQMQKPKKTLFSVLWNTDLLMLMVLCSLLTALNFVPPFERPFDITDKSISHPHLPDIVPFWWVIVFASIAPAVVVIAVTMDPVEVVEFYVEYGLGMAMTLVITEFFKVTVGRLRPDFLARCIPVDNVCTGSEKSIREGRKSFFSGHTSCSFYCIAHMVFWMLQKGWKRIGFRVSRRQTSAVVIVGSLLPFSLCSYVAISRSQQYIHHPTDILTGAAVAILIAYYLLKFHRN